MFGVLLLVNMEKSESGNWGIAIASAQQGGENDGGENNGGRITSCRYSLFNSGYDQCYVLESYSCYPFPGIKFKCVFTGHTGDSCYWILETLCNMV